MSTTTHEGSEVQASPGPLAGVRVVELDTGLAQFPGKLLADMGAEVIKVEPPEGSPGRRVGPFVSDAPDVDHSLHFWHYNMNKRSVALDLENPAARQALRDLIRASDVVLDDLGPGALDGLGLGWESLRDADERLIYAQVTPFGPTGPWASYLSSDLVQLALGGTMAATGYDDLDGYKSFPIAPAGGQAAHMAGVMIAVAIAAALNSREVSGAGQYVEVAAHDAVTTTNEGSIPWWEFTGQNVLRHTARHSNPDVVTSPWVFPCRDGKYVMCFTTYMGDNARFQALVDWFDERGLAEDLRSEEFQDSSARAARMDHVIDVIGRFCAATDSDEVFHGAQARALPWAPVNGPEDLLADKHLKDDRGAIVDVTHPAVGTFSVPGPPYQFSRTPWAIRTPAPDLGADAAQVASAVSKGERS